MSRMAIEGESKSSVELLDLAEKKVFDILGGIAPWGYPPYGEKHKAVMAKQIVESLSLPGVSGSCEWGLEPTMEYWDTQCGKQYVISNEGTPKDNEMEYCPFCGKRIC